MKAWRTPTIILGLAGMALGAFGRALMVLSTPGTDTGSQVVALANGFFGVVIALGGVASAVGGLSAVSQGDGVKDMAKNLWTSKKPGEPGAAPEQPNG